MKACLILALAPLAMAQQHDVMIHRTGPAQASFQVFTANSTPIKGAPYMAEAVTETVQRLADGTRITNSNATKVYRDSEGRTRTDATIKPLGPWVADSAASGKSISTIFDPVTNETLTLHHDTKTASKANLKVAHFTSPAPKADASGKPVRIEVERRVIIAGGPGPEAAPVGDVLMPGPGIMHFTQEGPVMIRDKANATTRQLGKRLIEGVECEGTLTTLLIPEGQIGNDRPIEVTTETWRAPSLKIDVLRKHVDPRFGETTYRVVNLVRAEQPRTLFEIPAGYEMKEMPATFNLPVERRKIIKD